MHNMTPQELLTIPLYREWLNSLPEYQSMKEVSLASYKRQTGMEIQTCGCPLEVYLYDRAGQEFIVNCASIQERNSDEKTEQPEWCKLFIDRVDNNDPALSSFQRWRTLAPKDLLEILDEVETCLAKTVSTY